LLSGCEREGDKEPRSEKQAKQQKQAQEEKPSKPEVEDTGPADGKAQTAESTNKQKPADASENVDANYVVSASDVVTCMLGEEGETHLLGMGFLWTKFSSGYPTTHALGHERHRMRYQPRRRVEVLGEPIV
jgi:hypothetical protein